MSPIPIPRKALCLTVLALAAGLIAQALVTLACAPTAIHISKTKTDIPELLTKHDVTGFAYATETNRSLVAFSMSGRRVQIKLLIPSIDDYTHTVRNDRRTKVALIWRLPPGWPS